MTMTEMSKRPARVFLGVKLLSLTLIMETAI
jgi:hypothetical protein